MQQVRLLLQVLLIGIASSWALADLVPHHVRCSSSCSSLSLQPITLHWTQPAIHHAMHVTQHMPRNTGVRNAGARNAGHATQGTQRRRSRQRNTLNHITCLLHLHQQFSFLNRYTCPWLVIMMHFKYEHRDEIRKNNNNQIIILTYSNRLHSPPQHFLQPLLHNTG